MKKRYFLIVFWVPCMLLAQVLPISSTEPIDLSGYAGATNDAGIGEYEIFLGNDGLLDKPILLVDGFDPGDTRNIAAIYASLDYSGNPGFTNLADEIRAEGYDVVILNFPGDGGADFIERNAMILVELITTINSQKAANNPDQNVILGPSMGGLISRYALNYMEGNTLDADTRLWISFDAPHLGANVPIGLQHQLNFLAFGLNLGGFLGNQNVVELQPLIDDLLKSSAARQLLIDHLEPHLAANGYDFDPNLTLPLPHPFRTQFEANINSFNAPYPENVRNVSVTNGNIYDSVSDNSYFAFGNSGDRVSPGFEIIDTSIDVIPGFLSVNIAINMTPSAASSPDVVSSFTSAVRNSSVSSGTINFDGVDAAPGGLFNLSGFTGGIPSGGIADDFLNAIAIDKFSFIPTVSALGLEITEEASGDDINWYHDINLTLSRATTDNTPFDNTYIPIENEGHTALNEDNVEFILEEIRGNTLSTASANGLSFELENNPIQDRLILRSNTNTDATVTIADLTGKTVFNRALTLGNRTSIPVNLASGFYILSIIDQNNSRFTTKFLAR